MRESGIYTQKNANREQCQQELLVKRVIALLFLNIHTTDHI